MKKVFTLALLSLGMMMSCAKENEEQPTQAQKQEFPKFYASMESADSRTFVDENYKLHWTADDRITIFEGNTYPLQYKFMGETGANQGEFEVVPPAGYYTGSAISANYAVYPFDENTSIAYDGTITYTVPTTQQYAEDSFGLGANPMVAVTNGVEDKFLAFKNIGGCFEFPLYGNNVKVKSIEFRGNNNEKLAGAATITAVYGEEPTMAFGDDATEEITLDCGEEGVLLSDDAENPTKFWIAVPATTFEDGFTITITDTNGIVTERSVDTSITIGRSKVQPFANALQLVTIQNNEIWYTTINGAVYEIRDFSDFTVENLGNITNKYENGRGVINFGENAVVTSIGGSVFFMRGMLLTSITIPDSVTEIGNDAFSECRNLTGFYGKFASDDNRCLVINGVLQYFVPTGLTTYTIPDGVTKIGEYAFRECSNLTSITIPDSVTEIGEGAFNNCSSLESITIPNGVTGVGKYAFLGCGSLKSFYGKFASDDNRCLVIDYVLNSFAPAELTTYTIPDDVTEIGEGAFRVCSSLESITIPDSVTAIGEDAFYYCTSLASITIPSNVSEIGRGAFYDCNRLASVYCRPTTPPTLGGGNDNVVFHSNDPNLKIYVPNEESIFNAYKTAEGWTQWAAYISKDTSSN